MNHPPEIGEIISISPIEDDHSALAEILRCTDTAHTPVAWRMHTAPALESALPLLRESAIPIVVCERELGSHTWKNVLAELMKLPNPPLLIVTSRHADNYLWAEALNMGAYDVLAKPFYAEEVVRVLSHAWARKADSGTQWMPEAECAVAAGAFSASLDLW